VICSLAKGNVQLSLFLTIFTNFLAIFTVPLLLTLLLDASNLNTGAVSIPIGQLILTLVFDLLIPLFVGKLIRHSSDKALFLIKKFPWFLKLSSSACLCLIPFMRVAQSSSFFSSVAAQDYVVLILAVIASHWMFLIGNYLMITRMVKLQRPEVVTVTVMGSQKSMPFALTVLEALPLTIFGQSGLVVIAIVISHLFQTLFDSIFFQYLADRHDKLVETELVQLQEERAADEQVPAA